MTDQAAGDGTGTTDRLEIRIGAAGATRYAQSLARARDERWAARLFDRDTTLWTENTDIGELIESRLGWLSVPVIFDDERIAALEGFGEGVREAGFTAVVVCGMGGSSLIAHVLADAFGDIPDWPKVRVLDSTDPDAVAAAFDDLDPLSTLVVVSTKSGTTIETRCFAATAWESAEQAIRAHHAPRWETPGEMLCAITNAGHALESLPHHDELREVFLDPADVGGRYSGLTHVGLVPASLLGVDLDPLLESAAEMLERCRVVEPEGNPGVELGLAIGSLALDGRDKLTFVIDREIATFGSWLEQLIAESTGKHGRGIVPVDREPLGAVAAYGDDRVFVRISLDDSSGAEPAPDGAAADARLAELEAAGHPVIRIAIGDPIDLGGEIVRWEVATAIAGALLGVNPFDEPNVTESKERTQAVLLTSEAEDLLGTIEPLATDQGLVLQGDSLLRLTAGDGTLAGELRRHLDRILPGNYLALQAFLAPTPERDAALARIRTLLRDATHCATTAGYGPQYLHSTGQLHKGGAPIGWFLQITADHPEDREIPDHAYSYGRLIDAQALGDFGALEAHELPVLRVHLGEHPDERLATLEQALAAALRKD